MTEGESIRAFCDGLKKASSCARELASETDNDDWNKTAMMLDGMRENGSKLAQMRAMTRMEQLDAISLKMGSGVNRNPLK